jgi:copper chaperone CopZ
MMPRTLLNGLLVLSLTASAVFAASEGMPGPDVNGNHKEDPVLPEGRYSAKVAALVCESCAPAVEKALLSRPAVESASVNKTSGRVDFAIKKGAAVPWSELQTTLRASAGKMGMGADYTLSDFKITSAKIEGSHLADQVLGSGHYTAKVGAIVCGGCKGLIEKTLRQVPGIGAAQVDDKAGTVRFTVLGGMEARLSKVQNALRASAERMGMGADYELNDVQRLSSPKGAASSELNQRGEAESTGRSHPGPHH